VSIYQPPFLDLFVLPASLVEDCPPCCPRLWFAAVAGGSEEWRGGSVWKSADDSSFEEIAPVLVPATGGASDGALGNTAFGGEFDDTNTVTVQLVGGTLANATDAEVRAGKNWCVLGGEVLGIGTATLSYAGVYVLSHLLRGRRGTVAARATHVDGDRFVVLVEDGSLARVDLQSKEVGSTRYFRAVAAGGLVSDALSVSLAVQAAAGEIYVVAHGFALLDAVYSSGVSTWVGARADAESTLADGIVVAVPSADTFVVATAGRFRVPAHGKTAGSDYYLSAATAAALTTTKPGAGNFVQRVMVPVDADTVLVNIDAGVAA